VIPATSVRSGIRGNEQMRSENLPAYHFEGTLVPPPGASYLDGYLDCPFQVPVGVGAVHLRLEYAPLSVAGVNNLITLGLFDPQGFRGNAHRHPPDREVRVAPGEATAGFMAGPIRAGRWLAQLAVHSVVPGNGPCHYKLDIELLPAEGTQEMHPFSPPVRRAAGGEAGWYRGELHAHTLHSDGGLELGTVMERARQRGYDFLAITDHNTHSALGEIETTLVDGLLVIPGLELTTFYGHALALGVDRWVNWRTGYGGWCMEAAAQAVKAQGGVFIIAHPSDVGSPLCTGCRWEYPDFDLRLAEALEIWNGSWRAENSQNLRLWQRAQMAGQRLTATAGCDYHNLGDWNENTPFNYIYARGLSVPELLEGIRSGRVVVSRGPWLEVRVSAPGGPGAGSGETLQSGAAQLSLQASWRQAPQGARLAVMSQQGAILTCPAAGDGGVQQAWEPGEDGRAWAELYAADGALLALANPVFVRGTA
jgi:hypothetical protein